jgi:hypothetical protein
MKTHAPIGEHAQQKNQLASQPAPLIAQAESSFEDARPEAMALQRFQNMAADSPRNTQLKSTQAMMANSAVQQRLNTTAQMFANKPKPFQRMECEEPLQAKFEAEPAQLEAATEAQRPNNTGLPDNLKSGIENLSGMSMDHVKVHYNSDKPAQLQAHAYAQGSEIHVAPGQEQHLPHEAWHVVQQAQGRVKPTVQMKGGVDVNDDTALEAEADVMGAKVFVQGSGEQSPVLLLTSSPTASVQRAVVQRRLPAMNAEQISAEPKVAAELLVYSLRNLKGDSLTTYFAQDAETAAASRDAWIVYLQGAPSVEQIGVLAASMNGAATVPAYVMEPDTETVLAVDVQTAIGLQLVSIVVGLGTAIGNAVLLKSIMGVGDDQVGVAVTVLTQARTAIQAHIDAATCPVVIGGNKEHNLWVGVGGMTSQGAAQMQLSQASVNSLAAGGAPGKATLVHEFTHAAANTEDHAYTTEACYGLEPARRLSNATTYEHAYLEATSAVDERRHYNPNNAVQAAGGQEQGPIGAARMRAARRAAQLAAKVWNNIDNAYIQARQIAGGEERTQVRLGFSALATYPHTPMTRDATYGMGLAVIEDRTKMLIALKNAGGHKAVVRAYEDAEVLDGLLGYEVLGKSIAALGIMSESDAMQWAIWLEKAPAIESFLKEKRSTYM